MQRRLRPAGPPARPWPLRPRRSLLHPQQPWSSFFPFIILGLLFYFLLIRPQQRKLKQHGDFLSKIKRGDEVLTSSGIFGRIEGLTDQFAVLEVADNVRIRILKSQISSFARQKEEEGGGSQKKSSAKKTLPQKAGARRAGQARRGKKRRPANV